MANLYGPSLPKVSDSLFSGVLQFGDAIVSLFSERPELLDAPYRLTRVNGGGDWYAVDTAAFQSPIVAGLHARAVNFDAVVAENDFGIWKGVIFPDSPFPVGNRVSWIAMNVRAYALVDLSIYYIRIANIYLPNSGLIKNLYATNVETDAIGRLNEDRAELAVQKIVRRYGINVLDERRVTQHVIMMMKNELRSTPIASMPRGVAFERECGDVLRGAGFSVQETPASGDFGADLLAFKHELSFAIQCKDTSRPVGVKAVQEAVGARSHYKVDYAVVCAVANFTDAAIELATSNSVILSNSRNLVVRLDGA